MGLRTRLLSVVIIFVLLAGVFTYAQYQKTVMPKETPMAAFTAKDTLYFWYADEALTAYLESVCLDYYELTGYRVTPVLHSGLEYLEDINEASVRSEQIPDLLVLSNDSLEKAYLAGLASEIWDTKNLCNIASYPQAALDAVTYKGKKTAYPFYYETSALLFNKTYLQEHAQRLIEAQADTETAEAAQSAMENADSEEEGLAAVDAIEHVELSEEELAAEAAKAIDTIVPSTMDDILTFADAYDAPEQVEAVFKWDVSDIFYNYFVVGNYINVGGVKGDDASQIDIYNENAIACMKYYQALNQFFSIDTKESDYDSIIEEFIDGKIVYTIATTDAIAKIEEAGAEGRFASAEGVPYEYAVTAVPNLNETLSTRSMSVTYGVVINGYSEKKEIANEFAKFLTYDEAADLYARSGKTSARLNTAYDNEKLSGFMAEYKKSVPIPKMLETSNFWVQLEICFARVWSGENVNDRLRELSEQIMTQITGEEYTETYIEEAEEEPEEDAEYIDEEYEQEIQNADG